MKRIRIKDALHGPWWADDEQHEGEPPGLLHGDRWDPVTGAISRGEHGPIVGIVDFLAKTRYGFSSRGVPQYLFHPADPRFPPMIVGSKAAPTANQWAVITTKGLVWSTTKSRWPSVSLQQLLGPVGGDAEFEALRLRYLRPVPKLLSSDALGVGSVGTVEAWDRVFNIDPSGCKDVDDLFAWRRTAEGWEFAIGIADVAALVPPGSALDERARQIGQTLYRDGEVIEPMLPTWLSENAGSLRTDGPRGVVALVWRLGTDWCVKEHGWRRFQLLNQTAFTYESVLADAEVCDKLPSFLHAIGAIPVGEVDTHKWVEGAMILYNCEAAGELQRRGGGILRRHQGIRQSDWIALAERTGCAELAFLGYAAGEYVGVVDPGVVVDAEVGHAGLGVPLYCHATSPLRRYADLVNQRVLVGLVGTAVETATWLNERAKEARAYERDAWCLAQLSPTELKSAAGWVVKTNPIRVYVPTWKRTVKVNGGEASVGDAVTVTAFWNLRSATHRFVFAIG